MAPKKARRKKKPAAKKPRKKLAKKAAPKKSAPKKAAPKKAAPKKSARKKAVPRQKSRADKFYGLDRVEVDQRENQMQRSARAGQSGDDEGLSRIEQADSESVDELADEGQAFEAEAISGVQNAPDPDVAEVKTHEVPEDDVPTEYDDQ